MALERNKVQYFYIHFWNADLGLLSEAIYHLGMFFNSFCHTVVEFSPILCLPLTLSQPKLFRLYYGLKGKIRILKTLFLHKLRQGKASHSSVLHWKHFDFQRLQKKEAKQIMWCWQFVNKNAEWYPCDMIEVLGVCTIICSNNATHSLRLVKNTQNSHKYNNHFPFKLLRTTCNAEYS